MLLSTCWMFPGLAQTHRIPPPWSIITIRTSTSASGNTAASHPDQSITLDLTAQPPFSYSMPTPQASYPLGPPLSFSNAPTIHVQQFPDRVSSIHRSYFCCNITHSLICSLGIPHIEVAVFVCSYIGGSYRTSTALPLQGHIRCWPRVHVVDTRYVQPNFWGIL